MERLGNSDPTGASTTADSESQPAPVEVRDHGSSGGEERINDIRVVDESAAENSAHAPRQDVGAEAISSPEAAPISMTGRASHAVGTDSNSTAVDSAAVVRLLRAAAQQISDASAAVPPPIIQASQSGNGRKPAEAEADAAEEDRQGGAQRRQRDEVQLVEIRNPEGTGWSGMSKAVRDYDEEEIGYYKDDIDTLLVFAGLYSAVLSAFIIESYTFLQPDPDDKMIFLFQNMVSQNYTMSNGFLNATNPYPALPEFEAPTWAIRVNVLWFSSLVVSLAAASYGMLVKQWLREYLNMAGITAPRERLRARQYRRPALDRWMVFEIAASLPLLLEIALGLFFIGLCYFTTAIHSSISRSTIPFVAAWAFFFIVATIAPLVSPRCPFKTTILRAMLRQGRKAVLVSAKACLPLYIAVHHMGTSIFDALRNRNASVRARFLNYTLADVVAFCYIVLRACAAALREDLLKYVKRVAPPSLLILLSDLPVFHLPNFGTAEELELLGAHVDAHMEEERKILLEKQDDIAILRSVEEIMPGDGLLPTLVDVASAANPPWNEAFALMKTVIDNRTGRDMNLSDPSTWNDSLQLLSQQSCDPLTGWVSNTISRHQTAREGTLHAEELSECVAVFCSLIFSHTRPLSDLRETTFHDLIFRVKTDFKPFLFHSDMFIQRIEKLFSGYSIDKTRMGLSHAEWAMGAENLILGCDDMTDYNGDIGYSMHGHWISNALVFLVTQWTCPSSRNLPNKNRASSPFTNRLVEKLLDELCRIDRRGRIYDIASVEIDVFYGILLGGATSNREEWKYPWKLFARNLTSICWLSNAQPYIRSEHEGPTSPKTAFLTLMKSHSKTWMETLLGWLAPRRMPGNILSEIVAADLAACEPEDQRRKLGDIIRICQIASLEISPPDSYSTDYGIDFATLLQIVILLQRDGVLDEQTLKQKVPSVQAAFRTAVICRHTAYRVSFAIRREDYFMAFVLALRMRAERLDLVYAMSYGCYRESGWVQAVNQRIRDSDWGREWPLTPASVVKLRLLVGDAWVQKEQGKTKPKPLSKPSEALILLPADPAECNSTNPSR